MPNFPSSSTCLHIPVLYEESPAIVSWEKVGEIQGYELERSVDESFWDAQHGRSWEYWDECEYSWDGWEALDYTWQEIAKLDALGLTWENIDFRQRSWQQMEAGNRTWLGLISLPVEFTIFRGLGFDVPAPQQGWGWNDYANLRPKTWDDLEAHEKTWDDLRFLISRGRTWGEWHKKDLDWRRFMLLGEFQNGYTWREIHNLQVEGMSWEALEGRHSSWDDWEALQLTWQDFEELDADDKTHAGCETNVPFNHVCAYYRVRNFNAQNAYSNYLETGDQRHVSRDILPMQIMRGQTYRIQVDGTDVRRLEDTRFTLRYESRVVNLQPVGPQASSQAHAKSALPMQRWNEPNEYVFYLKRPETYNTMKGGLACWFDFTATGCSNTQFWLERVNTGKKRVV